MPGARLICATIIEPNLPHPIMETRMGLPVSSSAINRSRMV